MYKLLVNGSVLNIGDRLRHRILSGEVQLFEEFEVIKVEKLFFTLVHKRNNNGEIPENLQFTRVCELANLNTYGFEKLIKE